MEGDGSCFGKNGNGVNDDPDALGNTKYMNQTISAPMPTERSASHYKMDHKQRGMALVFNHEHFDVGGLRSRSGTKADCETFVHLLEMLGFEVFVFHNLEYRDLNERVTAVANMDHSANDCFLLCVLSHGELGILYAKDSCYKPDNLWSPFTADKCPSLAGKPKMFFIQACQGDKLDAGVTLDQRLNRTETDGNPSHSYRIPQHADFLIAYSTVPGYYSWRNTTRGSWFIQALCEELQHNAFTYDLLTLLTFVCQRVALDYESNTPDIPHMHRQKQIPCITTMLTRLIKFTKKGAQEFEGRDLVVEEKEKAKPFYGGLFHSLSGKSKSNSYQVNN